jgi:hypothetical protein
VVDGATGRTREHRAGELNRHGLGGRATKSSPFPVATAASLTRPLTAHDRCPSRMSGNDSELGQQATTWSRSPVWQSLAPWQQLSPPATFNCHVRVVQSNRSSHSSSRSSCESLPVPPGESVGSSGADLLLSGIQSAGKAKTVLTGVRHRLVSR